AARVISFPGRAGHVAASLQAPHSPVSRLAARWIAVAAAAGLFVGVAANSVFNFGPRFGFGRDGRRSNAAVQSRQVISTPSRLAPAVEKAVVDMDDMFMSDLEAVLDRPHTSELVAFDALTPHVREIRDSAR